MFYLFRVKPTIHRSVLNSLREVRNAVSIRTLFLLVNLAALASVSCVAQSQSSAQTCPRPAVGATISNPPELRSHNGKLEVAFHVKYQQTLVSEGPPRYCYITDDGVESPTLRVHPGDELIIHLHNDLAVSSGAPSTTHQMMPMTRQDDCSGDSMDLSTTNLHFHGMTIPPVCHQDEVIRTAVHPGQVFDYDVKIPQDEPPGIYWYHPHPHGFGERQVQGGASGAIIVEGIEKIVPALASYPEKVIILRDQQRIGMEAPGPSVPAWDISVNFVPVIYPGYQPAVIESEPGESQLWRVVNAGADTIFNLQILSNGIAQPVEVVGIDGSPVIAPLRQTHIPLPPGARAEFVVTAGGKGEVTQLVTKAWDTGPSGDTDPERPIANVVSSPRVTGHEDKLSARQVLGRQPAQMASERVAAVQRTLYFSQHSSNAQDPDNFVLYFITVVGQKPEPYKMGSPPNIVVHQGDIEDWTIENHSTEDHVFHIHQIHFRVLEVNGKTTNDDTLRDTLDVPYWNGKGPYPSVKLRMEFTDPNSVGTFLYHCHILKHEDMGMMGSIQVLPSGMATSVKVSAPSRTSIGTAAKLMADIVSGADSVATGTVQFSANGVDIGKPVQLANGHAFVTTSFDKAGIYAINATYSGDSGHDEALSPSFNIAVQH